MSTRDFTNEFIIKTTRSSGKGGQNVNKVSTKVELSFNLQASALLTDKEKELLADKWRNRLTRDGTIRIICQEDRSQLKNKEVAIKKFYDLLKKSLQKPKKRIATKPDNNVKEKRLKEKKLTTIKKEGRKGLMDWEN